MNLLLHSLKSKTPSDRIFFGSQLIFFSRENIDFYRIILGNSFILFLSAFRHFVKITFTVCIPDQVTIEINKICDIA